MIRKGKVGFKMTSNDVNKQLQCTYCPISHEAKTIRQ